MKIGLSERIKILLTGDVSEHSRAFLAGEDMPGDGSMNADIALKYSAVFACCRVLAETYASVPIIMYKKDGKDRIPITELTKGVPDAAYMLYDALHSVPNQEMSAFNFRESIMMSINLGGNAVCEKLVNSAGNIVGLYPYPHTSVEIKRNEESGDLIYIVSNGRQKKTLSRSDVLHIPGVSLDGVTGLSPISYAAQAIRLGLSNEKYGVNFYRNAATPSGVFEHPATLSDSAFDRLKKDLKESYTGLKNSGVPMILEEGMKWQQVTISPVDAQLLESKYFQIEDICRIYRVPQHLVNKLDRSTNNNIEHQSLEFAVYTMLPHFKRNEECMNAQTVAPALRKAGFFLEHKMDGLLRGDSVARAALYANGRQWGWLSSNDIRKLENLPSLGPGGDIYLQPANMFAAGSDPAQQTAVNARMVEEVYNLITQRKGGEQN
jgi:HK97 family phage portal protein